LFLNKDIEKKMRPLVFILKLSVWEAKLPTTVQLIQAYKKREMFF